MLLSVVGASFDTRVERRIAVWSVDILKDSCVGSLSFGGHRLNSVQGPSITEMFLVARYGEVAFTQPNPAFVATVGANIPTVRAPKDFSMGTFGLHVISAEIRAGLALLALCGAGGFTLFTSMEAYLGRVFSTDNGFAFLVV